MPGCVHTITRSALDGFEQAFYKIARVERVAWWWNRKWGRLARRDVMIYYDGAGHWQVQAREGGVEGRFQHQDFTDESQARDIAMQFMAASAADNWRAML